MLNSAITLAALVVLSNGFKIQRRQDAPYHYMAVDYDYGFDSRVTTNLTFGTESNATPIQTVMDTGSANFWVWEKGAVVHWGSKYLGVVGACNETAPITYDPEGSPTSKVVNKTSNYAFAGNAKLLYGDRYSNDTITAAGGNGPIPNIQFAMENYALIKQGSEECLPITYDSSILGLSPYTNNTSGPSFRQNLFDAGHVASKVMVMWFDKHIGSAAGIAGRMTGGTLFGAIDTSKFTGPLVRVPNVVNYDDYQVGYYVPKPNVTMNGVSFVLDEPDTTCLLDSGSHGDALPFQYDGEEIARFFSESGLVQANGYIAYNGTCESIPDDLAISYTWAGVNASESITIDMLIKNYARGGGTDSTGQLCHLNLDTGGCLFGAPFLSAATIAMDDEDETVALAKGGVSKAGSGIDTSSLKIIGKGQSFDTV